MKNETILTESKTSRNEIMQDVKEERINEVLNKVKGLVLLPNDTHTTIDMVADYYEVGGVEAIKSLIFDNKEELEQDGLKILKGKELKEFKGQFLKGTNLENTYKFAPSLTLIPRRAILRIGMLLRDSDIAKQVRTYLLNVEENSTIDTKLISITNDIQQLKLYNSTIITENEELKHTVNILINKVDELLEQPLFKIHTNVSRKYDVLMIEFLEAMESIGVKNTYSNNYTLFNKEFSIWTGVDFGNKKINKKQYWISYYGVENIKQFVVGIKQGIIIKNSNGYWVSKSGIYTNKIEWNRTLQEFDNKCAYCGSDVILIAEHITPQSNEKSTDCVYNLIPSCSHCNELKGTMGMKEWLNLKRKDGITEEQILKIRKHWKKYYI